MSDHVIALVPRQPAPVAVVVTRHERDILRFEAMFFVPADAPELDDRDEAVDFHDRLSLAIALRDDLGWDPIDDDRDEFTVTVDGASFQALLAERRDALAQLVEDELSLIEKMRDCDRRQFYVGVETTTSIRLEGERVRELRESLAVCDAILQRLGAEG